MTVLNQQNVEKGTPKEGIVLMTVGDTRAITVKTDLAVTSDGSLACKLYLDNDDKSATCLTGSITVDSTGKVTTTKKTANLTPGTWMMECQGNVGSRFLTYARIKIIVRASGDV